MKSLERRRDVRLYLLVKYGENGVWGFPSVPLRPEDTLRKVSNLNSALGLPSHALLGCWKGLLLVRENSQDVFLWVIIEMMVTVEPNFVLSWQQCSRCSWWQNLLLSVFISGRRCCSPTSTAQTKKWGRNRNVSGFQFLLIIILKLIASRNQQQLEEAEIPMVDYVWAARDELGKYIVDENAKTLAVRMTLT